MARIEQRICDRCQRVDTDGTDHGWHELDVNGAQIDLCRGCSKDFILWVSMGPTQLLKGPEGPAPDMTWGPGSSNDGLPRSQHRQAPAPRHPVVAVERTEPPRG